MKCIWVLLLLLPLVCCYTRNQLASRIALLEDELTKLEEMKMVDGKLVFEDSDMDSAVEKILFDTTPGWAKTLLAGLQNTDIMRLFTMSTAELNEVKSDAEAALAKCQDMFENYQKADVARSIARGALGFIPMFSEIHGIIEVVTNVARNVSDDRVSKADVVENAATSTVTKILDFFYTWGTLHIAPTAVKLIGMATAKIIEIVEGEEGKYFRSCSACYLASLATRTKLEGYPTSIDASAYFIRAKICKFPNTHRADDEYIYKSLEDKFGTAEAIKEYIQIGVSPATKGVEVIKSKISSGNYFQQAVKLVSPAAVSFLMDIFWEAVVKKVVGVAQNADLVLPLTAQALTHVPIIGSWEY